MAFTLKNNKAETILVNVNSLNINASTASMDKLSNIKCLFLKGLFLKVTSKQTAVNKTMWY